jgi:hypothetical protein
MALRRFAAPTFLLQNVRRALVGGEQVGALPRLDEGLQRLHPRQQPNEIVLPAKREHRIDQIVPNPRLALLHLQPVGEEIDLSPGRALCKLPALLSAKFLPDSPALLENRQQRKPDC